MTQKTPLDYKNTIQLSGFDIYSPIEVGDKDYWISTPHLEYLLNQWLTGQVLKNNQGQTYPNRTRSKVLKTEACKALGYPIPKQFKRKQPKFIGQQFDIYGQKALNLQIWNEPILPTRRYAIVDISDSDVINKVRVVYGQDLILLDKTGKITKKYQARIDVHTNTHELISTSDTEQLHPHINDDTKILPSARPVNNPESGILLSIEKIFLLLSPLVGQMFTDPGADQERNRGAALHSLVCRMLGYSRHEDNGQFPDVCHQLLEVKLQTSPTIDLGMVLPNSEEDLVMPPIGHHHPRHCDTRYAVFYAKTDGVLVTLTHLIVVTGTDFFTRFPRFGGRESNGKIQIPLPRNFFCMQPKNTPNPRIKIRS